MSAPIKTYSKGKCQLAIWQGEYEGKPSFSFSLKKSYYDKKTSSWKDTAYYTVTDLQDIQALCETVVMQNILKSAEKKNDYKQEPVKKPEPVAQPSAYDSGDEEVIPF